MCYCATRLLDTRPRRRQTPARMGSSPLTMRIFSLDRHKRLLNKDPFPHAICTAGCHTVEITGRYFHSTLMPSPIPTKPSVGYRRNSRFITFKSMPPLSVSHLDSVLFVFLPCPRLRCRVRRNCYAPSGNAAGEYRTQCRGFWRQGCMVLDARHICCHQLSVERRYGAWAPQMDCDRARWLHRFLGWTELGGLRVFRFDDCGSGNLEIL